MEKESSPWWNSILNLPGILISGIQTLFEDDIKITNKSFGGTIELTEKEKDKIDLLKENVSANIDKKLLLPIFLLLYRILKLRQLSRIL